MVRLPGKGKKIAWGILGVPANIQDKKNSSKKKLDKELEYKELIRSK